MKPRGALYLLASWRAGCNSAILRTQEQLQKRSSQFVALLLFFLLFEIEGLRWRLIGM